MFQLLMLGFPKNLSDTNSYKSKLEVNELRQPLKATNSWCSSEHFEVNF